ncbi:MAG: hypothetical protein K9J37_03470 [Saprospiraceae bacterium]|nr:hypothetical protein [Saprospiraceae bacterium]MCF8248942.1 hypothetical protein [Saprospiraceae bacterium]MCF8279153.1 hypothetical protein [Bacteroidales bacterium]MCF8310836.1 hypothetical protein [Saprospiraceae bacterium]MCF8439576.1 hypothetical protein [Saprospiraceae bacterium]
MKKIDFLKTTLLITFLVATAFNLNAHNGVMVSPKLYLKGAMQPNGLMRDALRAKGLLPSTEPYSALPNFQHYGGGGGETISSPAVFQVTGSNAIVDWVVVELRSDNSLATPVATRAALLQRDGDVVAVDGISPVRFLSVAPGQYHVSVRHRSHLGVMTEQAFNLTNITTVVDFSNPAMPLYGSNACAVNGDHRELWLGDANRDKRVIHMGPFNDTYSLFSLVVGTPANANHNVNYMLEGYFVADYNLDGYAIFNGPNNDRALTFIQAGMSCNFVNCILVEQIP